MNFSKNHKISQAITVTEGAAGQVAIEGAVLDMAGFEGVLMEITFGAITAGAATSIKAQQGAAAAMGDAADLLGTSQTIADTGDEKTYYIDLYKPKERYVRLYVSRATQDSVVASATYIQYGAHKVPVTHGSNVSGELHASPAEGTA